MRLIQIIFIIQYYITIFQCKLKPLVIKGSNAKIENYPYSAFLTIKYKKWSNEIQVCGASIVNQIVLLTAAHCVNECTYSGIITAYIGHEIIRNGVTRGVHSLFIHDDFNEWTFVNDVALLKLKQPLQFNTKISRVALMANPPYYKRARLAGWGLVNEISHIGADILQFTKQYVRTEKECHEFRNGHALPGTICTAGSRGYASNGDSGSPLVVSGYIQIGLVSHKLLKPTNKHRNVVVFTDTGYHYKWIKENTDYIVCDK